MENFSSFLSMKPCGLGLTSGARTPFKKRGSVGVGGGDFKAAANFAKGHPVHGVAFCFPHNRVRSWQPGQMQLA
jgi:hypothetical protein